MTKLTKLIKTPHLFVKDLVKKRNDSLLNKVGSILAKRGMNILSPNGKATPPKDSTANQNLILSNIRLFKKTIHLIHTGENLNNGQDHIDQWIELFARSEEPFAILIRNKALFEWAIAKYSYVDIVYAKAPIDVESVLEKLPFLKAIYYLSNTGNLIHTLRYNNYKHVFLGHGDSDKAASAHKFFRVYDEIWVAGEAHIDRFRNAGFKTDNMQFIKIGRPTLQRNLERTLRERKKFDTLNTLVYLPTWEGGYEENNYSSAYLSPIILSEVSSKYQSNIIAKYHPATGTRDPALHTVKNTLNELFLGKDQDLEIMNKLVPVSSFIASGDAFICDISAVVSECISTLAPIFLYKPADRQVILSNSNMDYSEYTYVFSSIEELMVQLEDVFVHGNDPLAELRYKALDYLLTIDATVSNEFFKQLKLISQDATLVNNPRDKVVQ